MFILQLLTSFEEKKFFLFDSPNPVKYLSIKKVLKSQIKRCQEPTFHPGANKKS